MQNQKGKMAGRSLKQDRQNFQLRPHDTARKVSYIVEADIKAFDPHYALDLWVERRFKPECRGEAYYFRYADDSWLASNIARTPSGSSKKKKGRRRSARLLVVLRSS